MSPPPTEPVSIAIPEMICPLAKTDSRLPLKPVKFSASTSQASVAPEKKVNPSPKRIEVTAQTQKSACACHAHKYKSVETPKVSVPRRYDARLPSVSAMIPVGISKITCP